MSSTTIGRRRAAACHRSDKATYPSKQAAWREIDKLQAASSRDYSGLNPYHCRAHKGWHIGNLL